MKHYGETPEQAVQATIDKYRHAATFLKPLRDTLEKFGGKVYNKRFLDALRTAAGYDRIYDDKRAEMVFIYYYEPQHYDQITICRIALDDKRINAVESKQSAVSYYTKHLQDAAALEEYAPQVDTIRQRLDDLDRLKRQIMGAIPYEIRDIYGIR